MTLDYGEIQQTISPLRLIFWGGLFCLIDITYASTDNGEGWKLDLFDDAVGMILILYGLARLREVQVDDRYAGALRFVSVVAFFALLQAIHNHFIYQVPPLLTFLFNVLGVLKLIAIIVFCVAMRRLCESASLVSASRSWYTTINLFILIYLLPLGFFYVLAAFAMLTGNNFNYHTDSGDAIMVIPVLLIFFIPLIHFFMSTSRMINEAEEISRDETVDQW